MEKIKSIFVPRALDENPYQTQLIANLEQLGTQVQRSSLSSFFLPTIILRWKPNIVHLHWLNPLFLGQNKFKTLIKTFIFIFQVFFLKVIGMKIVWTVHNLKNHENINLNLDRICTTLVVKLSSAIITHCQAAKEEVIKTFSLKDRDKVFVVPHGNYIECYENKVEKKLARKELGLTDYGLVFLFLGIIRPYKGVLELIDAFKKLDSDEIQLVIAGKVYENSQDLTDLLVQKTADDQRIKFIPGFVAPEKIQYYMNASEVVIFPYRDVLTSGAVLLAMSFGRACIAPYKGCIGEVLDNDGSFLYELDDENGLLQAMNYALQKQSELLTMGQHNRQLAEQYNWKHIAEMTTDIYRKCL
jgi:glycosyltransferase involved in cell wall biosynthesis